MSQGTLRRQDKAMEQAEIEHLLRTAKVGHFATVSSGGEPYVVPNLFVYEEGKIYTHNARISGHFKQNVERQPRVCFEVAEIGQVWPYGEFECDTTTSYNSVIAFGSVRIEADPAKKALFFDRFMAKYADPAWERPKSFYPRLEAVTVYCIEVEQLTGKKGAMPALDEQWPAKNKTLSPQAVPPDRK
ncbi:MAG: putative pyridoxamine 5-phosphate oxidase [Chloroflexi bacterium]|jgi:nitroimidazol reductase NimA-like FMN-containing flavoprotein (pyridoxamine 5'-phosphate oxidase superfamily)|nr:putative pyridoxamine 5-phosphate oxidase [Chloroflexota bacterium]